MSLATPARRLVASSTPLFHGHLPLRTRTTSTALLSSHTPRRLASSSNAEPDQKPNPVLDEYLRKNPATKSNADPKSVMTQRQIESQRRPGDLSASSIFEQERRAERRAMGISPDAPVAEVDPKKTAKQPPRDPQNMWRVLDPDPAARQRWQRKMVIRQVRRGGRFTRAEILQRTEREHLNRSHNMKTSVKKLGMLARQIAGKSVDDAILQMRFSNKKVAQEVLKQLEMARDEAIVMRGMGLGGVQEGTEGTEASAAAEVDVPGETEGKAEASTSLDIRLKNGKRHAVTDPTKIYIDQAWVGRGPYGKLPDFRARGQVNIMRTPWTSMSLLLKEEKTRVREWTEREQKRRLRRQKNAWVHLPDRPIMPRPHQWYCW